VTDYPDYTSLLQIVGSDITVPIDIETATIGNIEVDIKAQSITDLRIDIEAQSVGVYLQPDWQTKEGNDKSFAATSAILAPNGNYVSDYVVAGGGDLYITHLSFAIYASAAEDFDKQHDGFIVFSHMVAGGVRVTIGANSGFGLALNRPLLIPAGATYRMYGTNKSNHNCYMALSSGGYQV